MCCFPGLRCGEQTASHAGAPGRVKRSPLHVLPPAEKLLEELTELTGQRYVSPHAFTWIHLGLRDKDRAFDWLEREYEDRSNSVAWIGSWHMLDGFRSDPRYSAMMYRIGLVQVVIP